MAEFSWRPFLCLLGGETVFCLRPQIPLPVHFAENAEEKSSGALPALRRAYYLCNLR
jgi:hypothetical protein